MYFRRWTRMHLRPAFKYFTKYGVISPEYNKFYHLSSIQNPTPQQHIHKYSIRKKPEKDLDTKLIENLFQKYPDLRYEPLRRSQAGVKLNTFSYAYSFLNQQKKLMRQGYSIQKAFELTEQKYHQKMQRKLDQTLLSRGLAIGNRARSFFTIYQQQAEYESRTKTLRSKRQLQKYQEKLKRIKYTVEEQSDNSTDAILDQDTLNYQRVLFRISEEQKQIPFGQKPKEVSAIQIPKNDTKQRKQYTNILESRFSNLFTQFYQLAASKDRLDGLTDEQIIRRIQTSPSKIKRQTKGLLNYLKAHNIDIRIVNGQIEAEGNPAIVKIIKRSPQIKIAILNQKLWYERPSYSKSQAPLKNKELFDQASEHLQKLKANKPKDLTAKQRQQVKFNKKQQFELVIQNDIPELKQAYKVFETQEERLLRLQIRYYDQLIKSIRKNKSKQNEEDQDTQKQQKELAELTKQRTETVNLFRRLKYRLQKRYRAISAEELFFEQHYKLGDKINMEEDIEYEELINHLRKKSQSRRLTSLDQSNDNKIIQMTRTLLINQAGIPEGKVYTLNDS